MRSMSYPKIELHLHVEGAAPPELLFRIARRNDVRLPVANAEELAGMYKFQGFQHFIQVYTMVMGALRKEDDFRELIVAYAATAKTHGAVYIEAIFGPTDSARLGVSYDEIFNGYCDGAQQAWEEHGVRVNLTPDIARQYSVEEAFDVVRVAARYRERGVVGVGLGGLEDEFPPQRFEPVFQQVHMDGLAALPHAGEVAGHASVRAALELLGADRIRHGFRAAEDSGLVQELADRRTVIDVCPISNLRTGAIHALDQHPLPVLHERGVRCSLSTDDPAMFDTDLTREYDNAVSLWGIHPRSFYDAGVEGAICDAPTRDWLREIGEAFPWEA